MPDPLPAPASDLLIVAARRRRSGAAGTAAAARGKGQAIAIVVILIAGTSGAPAGALRGARLCPRAHLSNTAAGGMVDPRTCYLKDTYIRLKSSVIEVSVVLIGPLGVRPSEKVWHHTVENTRIRDPPPPCKLTQ